MVGYCQLVLFFAYSLRWCVEMFFQCWFSSLSQHPQCQISDCHFLYLLGKAGGYQGVSRTPTKQVLERRHRTNIRHTLTTYIQKWIVSCETKQILFASRKSWSRFSRRHRPEAKVSQPAQQCIRQADTVTSETECCWHEATTRRPGTYPSSYGLGWTYPCCNGSAYLHEYDSSQYVHRG